MINLASQLDYESQLLGMSNQVNSYWIPICVYIFASIELHLSSQTSLLITKTEGLGLLCLKPHFMTPKRDAHAQRT